MFMSITSVRMLCFAGTRGRMLGFRGLNSKTPGSSPRQHFVADCGKCSASVLL
jgi:hypothetical protein